MKNLKLRLLPHWSASSTFAVMASTALCAGAPNAFDIEKLVSDLPGALFQDPNLVNPWGMASSDTSPIWVANNGTGTSTLYNGDGVATPLVVSISHAPGSTEASPTGIVFNGGAGFELEPGKPAKFLFASEDGAISGWNPGVAPTHTLLEATPSGAIYKGLAIASTGAGDFLYAANFASGKIDVFDSNFALLSAGAFQDPGLPAGYSPFNIQHLGAHLFVTYAQADAGSEDDVPGAGHGYVSVFDLSGNFERRLVSGGNLNSPWGLAIAPSDFGPFAGDLLVGNFGDGQINAYDLATGNLQDTLRDDHGAALVIPGLWGLKFGNGGNGGDLKDLYFTAGIPGGGAIEDHGLFGEIFLAAASTGVPDAGASSGLLLGSALLGLVVASNRWQQSPREM